MLTSAVTTGSLIAHATTLNFVQTPSTTLYSTLSITGTSMRITPYPKDLDGVKLTMTDFGSSPTLTADPKKTNYEEIIGFTGITDNGDNTATLTGLSRDLTSKSPYTTTGTGKQHGAGAIVVFSNNPQMYARFAVLENTQTITGLWTFSSSPLVPTPTTAFQAVTKAYVDGGILAGGATSTESVTGLSRLATRLQQASSSPSTANTPLVLQAQYATSSFNGSNSTGLNVVVTRNNNTIDPNAIATSSNDTYNFGGTFSTTGTTTIATSTIYTLNAGRIIASSTISSTASGVTATSTIAGNLTIGLNASTTNLIISGTCTGCVAVPTIVTNTSGACTTSGGSPCSVNATCSGSQKVVGGGGKINSPQANVITAEDYPSSTNVWTFTGYTSASASAFTVSAYAICQ